MKIQIDSNRLKELERKEAKLDALEAGGVDNWEGYDFSLEEYRATIQKEEDAEEVLDSLLEILCLGVEEPAGIGCGYGFRSDAQEQALKLLLTKLK